jgi:hypothetical protein
MSQPLPIDLAAAIAVSGSAPSGQDVRRGPMTFRGAAVFQWGQRQGMAALLLGLLYPGAMDA